jgi:hypothetical protein
MKSVVICGSMRHSEEIKNFASRLRKLGVPLVFVPDFGDLNKDFRELPEHKRLSFLDYKKQVPELVLRHFDRIRKADVCFVFNRNGYLGVNTTLEVGFAHGQDMVIYSLEKEGSIEEGGEVCRELLFTDIVSTPEELVERLKITYADTKKTKKAPSKRAKKSHGRKK